MTVYFLKKNTILYHGTSASFDEQQERLDSPCWVSDVFNDAKRFVTHHREIVEGRQRVIKFRLNKRLKLAQFISKNEFSSFFEQLGFEDILCSPEDMAEVFQARTQYDGWIIPNNYLRGGADILIVDSAYLTYIDTTVID